VYAITPLGRQTLEHWLETMLSTPAREFPDFPAALAFLPFLTPETVRSRLQQRADALEQRLAELADQAAGLALPRLFLIEDEYQQAMTRAELDWVHSLIDDLAAGRLVWSEQQLLADYADTPAEEARGSDQPASTPASSAPGSSACAS
jgi:ABC-type transporter lipoprotein component MlaA